MTAVATTKQASRRRQPAANPALSREEITRVALDFGSREGFEQLSMRSLARVLGVTPMALYHHVTDKQDLLTMLVDEVLAPVEVPGPEFGTWQERLAEQQLRNRAASAPYPGIDVVISEVKLTKNGERLMNGYLQILRDGGFSERESMLGLNTIYTVGYGTSLINRKLGAPSSHKETKRTGKEPPSLASEWRRLLKDEAGREAVDHFRQRVILEGLEAIKGTLSDEDA